MGIFNLGNFITILLDDGNNKNMHEEIEESFTEGWPKGIQLLHLDDIVEDILLKFGAKRKKYLYVEAVIIISDDFKNLSREAW